VQWAHGAYPGKVETGFPIKDMRQRNNVAWQGGLWGLSAGL
jgi:hypothetical protein